MSDNSVALDNGPVKKARPLAPRESFPPRRASEGA
jgi:hypothetical protein